MIIFFDWDNKGHSGPQDGQSDHVGIVWKVEDGIIYRFRTSTPWRDVPRGEFGPWQTIWKRHRRYAGDGTWDRVLQALLSQADVAGLIDWDVSVDATIARAHQHATNTTRPDQDTGGTIESQESAAG